MAAFNPVSNGIGFAFRALESLVGAITQSQKQEADHVYKEGQKTADANNNMIHQDDEKMKDIPKPEDHEHDFAEAMQKWQTEYNLINTKGQMVVNKLQTETQTGGTNLQAIGNFIQNTLPLMKSLLSILQTVASNLQSAL